jgi:hypothetical protein
MATFIDEGDEPLQEEEEYSPVDEGEQEAPEEESNLYTDE